MTTFTDKELIKEIKERISSLDVRDNIERRAYEIALASLEAEPVAWVMADDLRDNAIVSTPAYPCLDDAKERTIGSLIALYAAPPVPVIPAALPENDDEDGHDIDYLEPSEVYALGRTAGWNACRAAMLHGAEPVSQTYKLPPLSSSEVNDAAWKLHNMLTEHGPLNGRQFNNLKGCFYEALKVAMRNSPVTPDGWISCSERMPNDAQWCVVNTEYGYYVQCWSEGQGWLGDDISIPECDVINWMPLPEPPQEAK
ncbi:DUF551 domain-containing protein [Escherichia coli]|nr:DUF551 domain-containing protein [Salmonella enterica]EIL3305163.1 DUF551 domain-containing protein [Escherichia coli]MBW9856039.1 DUF551 domain-containing protein [Escherichia coli]MCU9687448.1 DUF551 domain-containing protein [Escherichia coli]